MSFATNPNLPLSYVRPTIAVSIDAQAPAAANADEASTVLLWGEQLTSGVAPFNAVKPLYSLQDAINNYGKKSTITRMMRAALSQSNVAGAVKFYGVGLAEPSAGTAGIVQVCVNVVDANGASGTNPLAAGGATICMGGVEMASVSWGTSDTATTIGESIESALNALEYAPFGTWTNNAGVVSATANAKGYHITEDYPIRVVYSKTGTGVWLGPGSITFANAPGGAAGSVVIITGATTITTAIDPAVENNVTLIAAKVRTQLLSNDYPLTAGVNAAGVLPVYFTPGADVRRPSCNIGTTTTTTAAFTNGSATDGSGDLTHAATYANTRGAGFPTLTTAVTNVRASGSFGKHVAPWIDATTAGAIFSAIVSDGDGGPTHQKGQTLTICSTGTQSAATTLIGATSPAMTSAAAPDWPGLRGVCCIRPDAAQPGMELAARVAAKRAAAAAFTNYDFTALTGTAEVPLLLPSTLAQVAFDEASQNTAIAAGLTPLGVQDGALCIVFGRNTISTTAPELWDWSWTDQADNHRLDVRAQARATFAGAALISPGTTPRSRSDVDPAAIEGFLRSMLRRWEAQGTYDGAEALADACQAQINPSTRTRADCVYPESPKVPLHTLGIVAQRMSPPTT